MYEIVSLFMFSYLVSKQKVALLILYNQQYKIQIVNPYVIHIW